MPRRQSVRFVEREVEGTGELSCERRGGVCLLALCGCVVLHGCKLEAFNEAGWCHPRSFMME